MLARGRSLVGSTVATQRGFSDCQSARDATLERRIPQAERWADNSLLVCWGLFPTFEGIQITLGELHRLFIRKVLLVSKVDIRANQPDLTSWVVTPLLEVNRDGHPPGGKDEELPLQ